MTVAITYILRELLFNIAQLSTARQEQLWRHFSLGATLAFFVFCVPLSPEGAFWRRPRLKALDEIYKIYTAPHSTIRRNFVKHFRIFAVLFSTFCFTFCFTILFYNYGPKLTNFDVFSEFQQFVRKISKSDSHKIS